MSSPLDHRDTIVCVDFVELVTDYVEGRLLANARRRVDEHLAGCDGCDAYLEQMRLVRRATGTIDLERMPEEMLRRLVEAFRASRQG
jgi:anti-sigma factor RsiW